MKFVLTAVVASVLLLTGCAQGQEAPVPVETESPAPTPESDYATPEQLASVISEREPSWREAADGLLECRIIWAIDSPDDPLAAMNGYSCYLKEQTATTNAKIALRELGALTPPPEMEDIVDRTVSVLTPIAEIDFEGVCGTEQWPSDTEACDSVLNSNNLNFSMLESVLDAWKPYL